MAHANALRREAFAGPSFGPTGSGVETWRTAEASAGSRLLEALAPGLQASFDTALDAPLTGRLAELLGRLDATQHHGTR